MSSPPVNETMNALLERLERVSRPLAPLSDRQLETNNVSGAYQSSGYAEVMEELCTAHAQEMGWTEPLTKDQRKTLLHKAFDDLGVERSHSLVARARWAMTKHVDDLHELRTRRRQNKQTERRMRRRAREVGAKIGVVNRAAIIARDNATCYLCGRQCGDGEIHIDHVVPLALGGAHSEDNLRVACPTCNIRKGASMPS